MATVMKRSRILILCGLLIALLGIPAAWKLASAGDGKSKALANSGGDAGSSSATASTAPGDESKSNRAAVDFAAKAKSMLELRPGELGILPIPTDFLGDFPGDPASPQSGNLLALRRRERELSRGASWSYLPEIREWLMIRSS
jgi:hypothetical protein